MSVSSEGTRAPVNRRKVFALTALLGATLLAIIAIEIGYRITTGFVCVPHRASVFRVDAAVGWTLRPDGEDDFVGCIGRAFEFSTTVHINSAGIHDIERGLPEGPFPDGRARPEALTTESSFDGASPVTLLLGDSMTEALQVPLEQNFVRRSQRELDAIGQDSTLVNAGLSMSGPDNALLWYRYYGRSYRPANVVFVWNLANDIVEVHEEMFGELYTKFGGFQPLKPFARLGADGALSFDDSELREEFSESFDQLSDASAELSEAGMLRERAAQSPSWLEWLHSNLFIMRRMVTVYYRVLDVIAPHPDAEPAPDTEPKSDPSELYPTHLGVFFTPAPARWNDAWKLAQASITTLARETRADGANFAVLVLPPKAELVASVLERHRKRYPALSNYETDTAMPRQRAQAWLREQDFQWVDATEDLRDLKRQTLHDGFFLFDPHLTGEGHAAVAKSLSRLLDRVATQDAGGA